MDRLTRLNRTLQVAGMLLDNAAGQIRDAALSPTKDHIHCIGEALCQIFEIQRAIYQIRPELELRYEEPPEDVRLANQRLGQTLIAAYDLADHGRLSEGVELLRNFAASDPSEYHRELANIEVERLSRNYET